MTDFSLEQLQAAFSNKESNTNSRPNNYFPFWNMKEGEQAIVRFLPDVNKSNPFGFLVEKHMHTIPVNGERKSIPCLKMYGEECPICKVSQQYYKEKDEANGKLYWRKKQHLAQALIMEDPLPADESTGETHEGKVRFLALGYQLFAVIKESLESGELDEIPFAYEGGTNFIIKKTRQGDYPKYDVSSKFARKSSDLTDDQIAKVQDEIIDLSTLLPQKPERERVDALLEASLTGKPLDDDQGSSSTPAINRSTSSGSNQQSVDSSQQSPVKESTEEDTSTQASTNEQPSKDESEYEDEADDILAQIRQRRKAKNN